MSDISWGILATREPEEVEQFLLNIDLASSLFSPENEFIKPALFNCLQNFENNPLILSKSLQMLQETHLLLPPGIKDEEISSKLENLLQIMSNQISNIEVSLSFLELLALLSEQNILRIRGSSSLPRHIFYYTNKVLEFHVAVKNIQRVGLRLIELVLEQQSNYVLSLQENNNTNLLEKNVALVSSSSNIVFNSVLESLQMYEDDEIICLSCLSILTYFGQIVSDILTPRVDFLTTFTIKLISKFIIMCEQTENGNNKISIPYLLIDQCLGLMYYLSFWESSMMIFARQTKGLFFFSDILLLIVYKYSEDENINVSSDSSVDSTIPQSTIEVQTRSILYTLDILLKILEDFTYATALFELVVDIHPIDYALEFQKKLIYFYEISNRVFNTKKNSDGFSRLKDTYKQINNLLDEMMKPEEEEKIENISNGDEDDLDQNEEVIQIDDISDLKIEKNNISPKAIEDDVLISKTPFSPNSSPEIEKSSNAEISSNIISNEESKELEKTIKKLKKEKDSLIKSISKEKERLKELEQERIYQEKLLEEKISQLDRQEQEKFDILHQKSELLKLQQQQYESMRKDESERISREKKELEKQQEDIHKLLIEQKEESKRIKEVREEWEKKKKEEQDEIDLKLKESRKLEEKILLEKTQNEILVKTIAEESRKLEILRQQDEDSDFEDTETGRVGTKKQYKQNLELLQIEKNHLLDLEKELKKQMLVLEQQKIEYEAYLHEQEVSLRDRSNELDKATSDLNEKHLELSRKEQQLALQQRQLQQVEEEKMKLLQEAQYKIENNFITQKELLDKEEDDKKRKFKEFQLEVEKKLKLQKEEMILKFKEKEEKLVKQQEILLNEHKKMIKELELKQTILQQEETKRLNQLENEFQQIILEKDEMMKLKILQHEEALRLQITNLQENEKELKSILQEKVHLLESKDNEIQKLQERLTDFDGNYQFNPQNSFNFFNPQDEMTPINPFSQHNPNFLSITTPDPRTHFDYSSSPTKMLFNTSPDLKGSKSSELDDSRLKSSAKKKISKTPSPSPFKFQPVFKTDVSCQTTDDWFESSIPEGKTLADKNLVDELISQLKSAQNSSSQSVNRANSLHNLFMNSAQKIELLVNENDKLMRRIKNGGDLSDLIDIDEISIDGSIEENSFSNDAYSSSFIRDDNYSTKSKFTTPSANSRRLEYSKNLSEKKKKNSRKSNDNFSGITSQYYNASQKLNITNPVAESGKNSLVLAGIIEGLSFSDTTNVPIEVSISSPLPQQEVKQENEGPLNMKSYVSLKREFEDNNNSLIIGEIDDDNSQDLDELADVIRRLFNYLHNTHNLPQPSTSSSSTTITSPSNTLIPAPHATTPSSNSNQPVIHIRFIRSALVAMNIIDGSKLTSHRAELIFASLRTKFFTLFGTAFAVTLIGRKYFSTENLKQFFSNFRDRVLTFLNEVEDSSPKRSIKITSNSLVSPPIAKPLPGDEMEAEVSISKAEFEELVKLIEKEKKCFFTIFEAYSTRYTKQSIGRHTESEELEHELTARIKYMKKLQEEDDKNHQRIRRVAQIYPEKFQFATSSQVVSNSTLQSENLSNFMTSHVYTQSSALLHGMSFQNILQFSKEFKISPDLLNRAQLIEIFKSASVTSILSSAANEYDDNIYLSFSEFLDFLYLVAIRCPLFKGNNTPLIKFVNLLLMLNLSGNYNYYSLFIILFYLICCIFYRGK